MMLCQFEVQHKIQHFYRLCTKVIKTLLTIFLMLTYIHKTYLLYNWQLIPLNNGAFPVAQRLRICLQCKSHRRHRFDPWVRKIPRRRTWQPTPVFLPGESHGQRSLTDHSPQGRKKSDTTQQLSKAQPRGMCLFLDSQICLIILCLSLC